MPLPPFVKEMHPQSLLKENDGRGNFVQVEWQGTGPGGSSRLSSCDKSLHPKTKGSAASCQGAHGWNRALTQRVRGHVFHLT